jgi:predicted Rossmann fold nucleotide-binding protein DprA/Smf involved in DNA uptake
MFNFLQRKLGMTNLTALVKQTHLEEGIRWEVVTARWKELYQHLKQMEVQMQEQQAQLRRYALAASPLPEIKDVPLYDGTARQATLKFYDRILKHLPQLKSLHVDILRERLKCSRGRLSAALCRLLAQGKIERTGRGMYRHAKTQESI